MAANDEDDAWLYGDNPANNNAEEQRKEELNAIFDRASEEVGVPGEEKIITTNGDALGEENNEIQVTEDNDKPKDNEEEKDSDDEDDSDDDVQVVIGDIKPSAATPYPYGGTPVNLNIKRGQFTAANAAGTATKGKGLDIDSIGVINGVNLFEFNLDTIEDKPWRKPGADITDYFNYGFNEDTWKIYCERQRKMRMDNHIMTPKLVSLIPGKDQQIPIATVNENSKYSGISTGVKKAGPPPGRRTSGSIDVICGANSARRSAGGTKENVIQVIGQPPGYDPTTLPPGLPPTHIPPPFIPPNLSVPPPGMALPPPTIPPPVPYADLYGNPMFSQPPPIVAGVVPTESAQPYEDRDGYYSSSRYENSESQHSWDRDSRDRKRKHDKDRDYYYEESRSRDDYKRSRDEYESSRSRSSRYRDYDRDYGSSSSSSRRERDYYESSSSRSRRDRERERDRDKEERRGEKSSKETKEKEPKEKKRRRHHYEEEEGEEESRHSSRHHAEEERHSPVSEA